MSEILTEERKASNESSEKDTKRATEFVTRTTTTDGSASLTVTSATKPAKDNWDKIAAVAPIISGIFIFLAGGVFSFTYNQQQLKVQEIQTIEKFIPHLTGSEQSKKAAILAINSLADAKLAGKIASIYASQGTVSALQSISKPALTMSGPLPSRPSKEPWTICTPAKNGSTTWKTRSSKPSKR